jgi:multidrug resistance protein
MVTHKIKLLFMFGLCGFLTPFIGGAINLSLPFIGKEFGMTIVSLSWIATTYLLSTTVFLVPFGRLADILGRKKIFIHGASIFTLATLLCCLANSGTFLIIARAIQGLGSAMIFGTSMAILISIFPPKERGKAIGINLAGVYLGSSLGPVLGGTITHYWSWRGIFLLTAILGAVVVYM